MVMFLCLLAAACSPDQGQEAEQAPDAAEPAQADNPPGESVSVHMGEHFWQISEAQNGAIAGNMELLREATQWLVDHEEIPGLPEGSEELVEAFRARAQAAAAAPDLEVAAFELANTAAACGTCHTATGNPLPTVVERPQEEAAGDVASQMVAHIQAADLMWDALLAPSDEAWEAGIETLRQVRLGAEDITSDPARQPLVRDLLERVRDVAARGAGVPADQRPALYGQLVATCGACHTTLGRGFAGDLH